MVMRTEAEEVMAKKWGAMEAERRSEAKAWGRGRGKTGERDKG